MEFPGPELQEEFFLWCATLLDLGVSLPVHGCRCEGHPRAVAAVLTTPAYPQVMEGVARVRAARNLPLTRIFLQIGVNNGAVEGRNVRHASIRLAEAVALWCAEGEKDDSLLLHGKRLAEGVELLDRFPADRTPQETAFVEASSAVAWPEKHAPPGRRRALAVAGFVLALAVAVIYLWRFGRPAAPTRHATLATGTALPVPGKPVAAATVPPRPNPLPANNTAGQAERAETLQHAGEALAASGRLSGAMELFRQGLAIRQRLAARDPGNATWQRGLADAWIKVADTLKKQDDPPGALKAYYEAEAIEQTCAQARPDDTGLQRDRFFNALEIGDLLLAQNRPAEALEVFRRGLAVQQSLCARAPKNAPWRRDLAVSLQRVADALDSQGDHAGALQGYQDGAAVLQTLSTQDPTNPDSAADLVAARLKTGDLLLAQNNAEEAVVQFTRALADQQKLVALDAARTEWQRTLAAVYERLGQARLAREDSAGSADAFGHDLGILRLLLAQDAANADRQHDVCVGLTEVGDAQMLAADLPRALASYREAAGRQRTLVRAASAQAAWQAELAETQDKIGQTLEAQKNAAGALPAYREALAVYEKLAAENATDDSLKSNVASVSYHLGRAAARRDPADVATASAALKNARDILLRLRSAQGAAFSKELADTLEDTTQLLTRVRD